MPLLSFKIEKTKAIRLASCDQVPRVMVIAGPNGVGKSTLLFELGQKRGTKHTDTARFLYQPPHRAVRRTAVRRRFLMGSGAGFRDVLERPTVEGYEGLNISFPSRAPDNVDEAGSTIKYVLGRLENKRQMAYARMVDQAAASGATIATKDLPDIYGPLKELTRYLLPHLEFNRIDFVNEDDIKCIWTRKDDSATVELDLDDLSSGEKSIVILFLSLLENEINRRLSEVTKEAAPVESADVVMIIDEPELHLHPDLQSKILSYMRAASVKDKVQFIMSTHSPTLLDQAYDEELFLFRPPGEAPDTNQLQKIANNIERLEALKELTGTTFVVTTGRAIVCIEGEADPMHDPADIQLLGVLYPRATAYTFVPVGSKSSVIGTVVKLREFLPVEKFGIKIFGLVDKDQGTGSLPDGVFALPVSMIENLLLDSAALLKYLQSIGVQTFADSGEVELELRRLALALRNEEVGLRVAKALKPYTVRLAATDVETLRERHKAEVEKVQALVPHDDKTIVDRMDSITASVDSIIAGGTEITEFRGKPILRAFYVQHVASTNVPYTRFCYEVAQVIAAEQGTDALLNSIFDQMV